MLTVRKNPISDPFLRRWRRAMCSSAILLAVTPGVGAQIIVANQGENVPGFEVATVKPSSKDLGRSFHTHIWWNDNSYRTENTTLRDLIRNAFDAYSTAQLTGGSDALLDSRWDLSAKIGDEDYARLQKLSREDKSRAVHLMVQALLADRFGLKVHIETRELPVFDLVLDKAGSRLQPAAAETSTATGPHASPDDAPAKSSGRGISTNINHDRGKMTATDATPADLTAMLGRQPELDGRTVVDKTGLAGKYDWTLEWQPQHLSATADPDTTGPSLFSALREQLGLKLEPSRGPVQVVAVDAVSNPTPN